MKKYIIYTLAALALAPTASSCLNDELPQTDGMIADQIANADKSGLVNGLVQYMNTPIADQDNSVYTGLGYPEHIAWHGIMTADMPIWSTGYNYWTAYSECLYMGNYAWQYYYWSYYNYLIYKASLVIKNCNPDNEADDLCLGTGLAYRAFVNHEMCQMYEYKATGTSQDDQYYERLKGQTVPIVNEYTTEEQAKNNPRAPFYQMYRYILNDLNNAEKALSRTREIGAKNYISLGVVYGLKARLWMDLGSRFERHPDDLALQIAHDNEQYESLGEGYQDLPAIGVNNANEAFAKAADYAQKAIEQGYSPLSQSEWYDKATGFNTANNSWMWGVLMSGSDPFATYYTWESWVSFMSPEASWGIASSQYKGTFMIDAQLFSTISDSDWRKGTWIDPADWLPENPTPEEEDAFRDIFDQKYAKRTNLSFDEWSEFAPYIGFKFHPGSGNTQASTTGNKVDIPLMRVEEMYLIRAEALAHSQGLAAGKSALESFVNSYRYSDASYKCQASSMRDFEKEVLRQKRIEFWGEGITLFDYKRLELPIERGYAGSNHPASYQYNSREGYAAPWTILYIPLSEGQQNKALLTNPDPSSVMLELKY